mmetsp:Transcript_17384/g.43293  ORF Transcript_17384/g.43293 Transcript_17384/m.43293 type:complete len:459 (-) Transcript_17384:366-1742(-)|eukprot:CAMPEP_0113891420 /NCGR_PEP_ID=MMETSP0780_2-20120614/14746_1 /TAXON_ID=652834 /ORGANISM="Palpitomonas bilix" /LENGTH=458 /DNA_ID=CAMNT_0000881035 /DNA_START=127 /DNA_END=1503 /DNA_ORIENTATION=+ /assembly_acc=CAM_ASM_000599
MANIKVGYLMKQGHGAIKKWAKRYFVLKPNRVLSYSKGPEDKDENDIDLSGYKVVRADEKTGKPYSIGLIGNKNFYLYGETESDVSAWIKTIEGVLGGGAAAAGGDEDFIVPSGQKKKISMDDFTLLKVLGRGGFGKVVLVRKKDTKKLYAMKVLNKEMLVKSDQVERTKEENRILRQVQHPYIVGLTWAFQTKEKLHLVLEFVRGGDLFGIIQREKRINVERVRLYTAELALSLGHLHSRGIIYRDLKPENVLVGEDGHVYLTDFGLSKEVLRNKKTRSICGTPEYLAPEIVELDSDDSNKGYGKEVDWWSLGTVIYEMYFGIPPFYSTNANEMYRKILKEELKFPARINAPDEMKDLIAQLLERDPKRRLGTGPSDIEPIKSHPFFAPLDWKKLEAKEIEATWKPEISSELDVSNFDAAFTEEPAVLTQVTSTLNDKEQEQFQGFTYEADSAMKHK